MTSDGDPAGNGGLDAVRDRMHDLLDENGTIATAARKTMHSRSRWPVVIAVALAIALQLVLPDRFGPGHRAVPLLELAMFIALVLANPHNVDAKGIWVRRALIGFTL